MAELNCDRASRSNAVHLDQYKQPGSSPGMKVCHLHASVPCVLSQTLYFVASKDWSNTLQYPTLASPSWTKPLLPVCTVILFNFLRAIKLKFIFTHAAVLGFKTPKNALRQSAIQRSCISIVTRPRATIQCYVSVPSSLSPLASKDGRVSSLTGTSGTDNPTHSSHGSEGTAASSSSSAPRGIRWLDREVRQGNVAEEELVGAGGRPPRKTDMLLRSYSKKARCGHIQVARLSRIMTTGAPVIYSVVSCRHAPGMTSPAGGLMLRKLHILHCTSECGTAIEQH